MSRFLRPAVVDDRGGNCNILCLHVDRHLTVSHYNQSVEGMEILYYYEG